MNSDIENGVFVFSFNSIQDFLRMQIDCYPKGGTQLPIQGMLYRGLSDENYKLIPTAHRWDEERKQLLIKKYDPAYSNLIRLPNGNERQVVHAELSGLKTFFAEANRQGCPLPHSFTLSNSLFKKYNNKYVEGLKEWYTEDIVELAALAQHSGFPTRLLDWTYDINTALYFAVQGVIKKLHSQETIPDKYVVWCVDAESLGLFNDHCNEELPIEFFVPNYADNPNLRAQSGVLSYYHVRNMDDDFSVRPIDELILNYQNTSPRKGSFLTKLVFSTGNVLSDFKYLRNNGYHAAKLFPGYDGVMRKLQEDEWIQELEQRGI